MAATDAELVRGALAGLEPAFREIVRRYQRPVFGTIVRVVRDPGRAEELAQDTFVKAFRALDSYDQKRRFAAWLLTIAHHVAVDEVRQAHHDTVSLDDVNEEGSHQIPDAKGPTPAALAERTALASALHTAIGRLRPEYRQLVTLKYEQEFGYEEIADITGLPMGTLKSSLHRALKELADELELLGWRR